MTDAQIPDFSARQPLPDLIRALALMGIVLVNIASFSWPLEQGYKGYESTALDHLADTGVTMIFMAKSYALFSLMFGVGLAFQIVSAKRQGKSPAKRHFRRMTGLFVLGLLHAAFFFLGDILILYAIIGSLLYAFRTAKPKTLTVTGISMLMGQVAIFLLLAALLFFMESIPPPTDGQSVSLDMKANLQTAIDTALAAFGQGGFLEATQYRASRIPANVIGGALIQGIGILGYFLLGLATVKSGLINAPSAAFWHKCRWQALPIGLLGSAFAAHMFTSAETMLSGQSILGTALLTLFAPFSAFGYAGWIAKYAAGPESPLKTFIARAGTASLTAYLMQSVILSFVFSAYGLGLYARLGAFHAIIIAFATGVFTLVFASLWRKAFERGPMETLLRQWTYFGKS